MNQIIPTSVMQDKFDNLVITSKNKGIFIGTRSEQFSSVLSYTDNQSTSQISYVGDSTFIFIMNGSIYYSISSQSQLVKIDVDLKEVISYLYDPIKKYLIINLSGGVRFYKISDKRIIPVSDIPNWYKFRGRKVSILPDGKYYLVLDYNKVLLINRANNQTAFVSDFGYNNSFQCEITYKNKIYLGHVNGLYVMDNYDICPAIIHDSMPEVRVSALAVYKDFLIIGTLGKGLFYWNGDKFFNINQSNGLISDNIEHLEVTDSGEILVSTFSGLSRIVFMNSKPEIYNYTHHNGLPSSKVHDCTNYKGIVLVATDKGIVQLNPHVHGYTIPIKPVIEKFFVNNLYRRTANSYKLKFTENSLNIQYKTIDIGMEGNINYEYQLNDNAWIPTKNTSVQLAALLPGHYTFKIRSENKNKVWSDPAIMSFTIDKPWWQTWIFRTCVFVILSSFIYIIYRSRYRSYMDRVKTQNLITRLKQSTLQAQMNPHFIFNCLGAIQAYILHNQKEEAMTYLTRFAQFIRLNLYASKENLISLDKETDMLSHYLELEQLRHGGKFTFDILIDNNIVKEEIYIPPLLVQPFVENAVLHGMKKVKSGGRITIHFALVDTSLSVSITDNV